MGGIGSQFFESICSYWRRRTYQKLQGLPTPTKKQHVRVVRLGGGSRANRRSWKVRPVLRMSVKVYSPIRLLARLRDAYVNVMLVLAGGEARPSALNKQKSVQDGSWGRRMPKAREMSTGRGDFERRMMLHIYRSIVAPPEVISF